MSSSSSSCAACKFCHRVKHVAANANLKDMSPERVRIFPRYDHRQFELVFGVALLVSSIFFLCFQVCMSCLSSRCFLLFGKLCMLHVYTCMYLCPSTPYMKAVKKGIQLFSYSMQTNEHGLSGKGRIETETGPDVSSEQR